MISLEQLEAHIAGVVAQREHVAEEAKRVIGELNAVEMALQLICAPLRRAVLDSQQPDSAAMQRSDQGENP